MSIEINRALLSLPSRSERVDQETLVETFVDNGLVFDILNNTNNEVIYGRRGTGKTHLVKYLQQRINSSGNYSAYLDLRTIGSTNSIYLDQNASIAERATRLLRDIIRHIHEVIIETALTHDDRIDLSAISPRLDSVLESIDDLFVATQLEVEQTNTEGNTTLLEAGGGVSIGTTNSLNINFKSQSEPTGRQTTKERVASIRVQSINYGDLSRRLASVVDALDGKRMYIFIDEWSSIPYDLQPFIADMIKRVLLPISKITIKIAAIEQRKNFRMQIGSHDHIGFELGADISSGLNLDDHLVYENNPSSAWDFFSTLIYKHYLKNQEITTLKFKNRDDFIRAAFTQYPVFEELVRASEGVPRDAIFILGGAARRAGIEKISVPHIRSAARNHYLSDKHSNVNNIEIVSKLLKYINDDVISNKKARCFLVNSEANDANLETLFDERIVHIVRREISSKANPGERYTAYKLDFGCYVHFRNTSNAVEENIPAELLVDVPIEDYRIIRRVILDLHKFYSQSSTTNPYGIVSSTEGFQVTPQMD